MKTRLLASGIALSVAMSGGCSFGESEPKPTRPNGTVEQVLHNLGGEALGKLPVGQVISFTNPRGEQIKLYNLTSQPVNEELFRRTVGYFATMGDQAPTSTIPIYPRGANNPTEVQALSFPRRAAEHDFVMTPNGTKMPPAALSNAEAATRYFPDQSQTVSIIQQPKNEDGQLAPFEAGAGLATEVCQSMIDVLITGDEGEDARSQSTNDRLGQETICNTAGHAMQQAAAGVSYSGYEAETKRINGFVSVSVGYNTYPLDSTALPPHEYAAMQQAVAGKQPDQ